LKEFAKIVVILTVFNTILSCNEQNEITASKQYEKEASAFISQVFSNKIYDCSYVIKPNPEYNLLETIEEEMPALDYRNRLMDILKVGKKQTLDSLVNLSHDFEFRQSMFKSGTELIDLNKYSTIRKGLDSIAKFGTEVEKDQMFSECPSEFYFISKPIFDKEYKTAVIDIQMGFTSIRSHPWIFSRSEKGTWE